MVSMSDGGALGALPSRQLMDHLRMMRKIM